MRYLILLLFFSIQLKAQVLVPSERAKVHITSNTEELQKLLFAGPQFQQPIVYIDYSPLYPSIVGLTRKIGNGYYIIDLNPIATYDKLEWVLMHELVHVWQLHIGILSSDAKHFYYRGKTYPIQFPYSLRPWEKEAEAITGEICNPTLYTK
jgi:hypothetical protein